uniref:Fe2OG dioxygenase domain-containing protein n=1 Tax=Chlamydomonas leiostraca TaxID=1034604 RepID=A0A7S0WXR7_9CHLO|mmetsp:Transcript_32784/g.83202  ORF Transcript_32784/g.83202 Transcript_32784/m.83202 type:complete len:355 (+) Transcript_32784:66-1130(+)
MPDHRPLTWALSAVVLASLLLPGGKAITHEGEEKLIGWKGEVIPDAGALSKGWVEHVAWKPRVWVYHNFITPDEALHIRKTAAPSMKRSSVVGQNGSSVLDPIRTSYGTFIRRLHDPTIARVMERVAQWVHLPPVHAEDMQVLRYGVGQKYGAHMDSLIDESPRMATVLIYLADTEEGGETAFPDRSEWVSPASAAQAGAGAFSECAHGSVAFKPKLGDALLFFSIKEDGTHEPASLHTGCPVVKGHKWTSTVWVHSRPFRPKAYKPPRADEATVEPGDCKDAHHMCEEWAKQGECEKNPGYMVGGRTDQPGACRAACKACEPCSQADPVEHRECINRNRAAGGWLVYSETDFM